MTPDGDNVPKYARVAAAVRAQIADGTLRPGQPAPSGAALSRVTGYSTLTCRRALRVLIADGVLTPGPSRNARPRVAGPGQPAAERDLVAATRALSRGLAAKRRAHGLTQPELAALLGISVTTIGHAETGRLWQSRHFWEHVDDALGADGDLLRLHEAFGEANASGTTDAADPPDAGEPAGTGDTAGPPAGQATGPGPDAAASAEAVTYPCGARAARPGACLAGGAHDGSPAGREPACVVIMWGDGTVTTVHPPEMSPSTTGPAETPP
jgi:hypothetical protein